MSYTGGKSGSGVYQKIINQIPPHRIYIEPFLGHGAIMRNKRPAIANIGIDSDIEVINHWRDLIATNDDVRSKLSGSCTVTNGEAISWIKENRHTLTPDTFVYLDPPYLFETRRSKGPLYNHEFGTVEQHRDLLDLILDMPCMVAISGYKSSLYMSVLAKWRFISFQTMTRAGKPATEYLWMNYPEPVELHDYRYLGDDYREREKIARQKKRWIARLKRMTHLQRYAMLSSIAEYSESAVPPKTA